jgi:hypothetical protein
MPAEKVPAAPVFAEATADKPTSDVRAAAANLAESAGIEPARPFGLVALAPRCLATRPTLQSACECSPRRDLNAHPEALDAFARSVERRGRHKRKTWIQEQDSNLRLDVQSIASYRLDDPGKPMRCRIGQGGRI